MYSGKTQIEKRLEKMEIAFDQEEFVVLDIGSGFIKAGFSGEDMPRVVIPTAIAEQHVEVDPSQANQPGDNSSKPKVNYSYGQGATNFIDTENYHEPVQRGIVEDFDRLEILLKYLFENELGVGGK